MIQEWLAKNKVDGYRLDQFNKAYYQDLIGDWSELTTWPVEWRDRLVSEVEFCSLNPVMEVESKRKDTVKVLFERKDGQRFETVLMKYRDGRRSVCVSSMIGCPVGCVFCATGQMKERVMLTGDEIVDQVLYIARMLAGNNERVSNVVYMGMGEPLLNLSEVMKSVKVLTDPVKFGLGQRRITLSTSGYVDQMRQVLAKGFRGKLAISLHAPTQEIRQELMPVVAKTFSLDELMAGVDEWVDVTGRRVSYEYVMIEQVNDSRRDAQKLIKLLKRRLAHVNLIPYNPTGLGGFRRSQEDRIRAFSRVLTAGGIANTVRVTMGDDISAACGQLANVRKVGEVVPKSENI